MSTPKPNDEGAAGGKQRPSHDLLMKAQELLGQARDVEQKAGNRGVSMVLNEMTLSIFQVALDNEIDELANRAFDVRYPEAAS